MITPSGCRLLLPPTMTLICNNNISNRCQVSLDCDEGVILDVLDDDVHVYKRVAETQRLSDKLDLQVMVRIN